MQDNPQFKFFKCEDLLIFNNVAVQTVSQIEASESKHSEDVTFGCYDVTEHGTTDVDKPYINMQPQIVSMADVCNVIEKIKGSIHRGACRRIHIEWNQTLERKD